MGQYDRAIAEIEAKLRETPNDQRLLQKLGELFQKAGRNRDAAPYFAAVARGYAHDGFFLKAMALCRQVLKLNPALLEARSDLARYFELLDMPEEARAELKRLEGAYQLVGNVDALADVAQRLAKLKSGAGPLS